MVRIFIFFGFFLSAIFCVKPVLALSCAPSFRVLMECDEKGCSKGFIILLTDGICESVYRIEDATPEGLKKLYDNEAVGAMDIPPGVLDFSVREDQGNGIYELSDNYMSIAVDQQPENPKKTNFKSLEEARKYWRFKKFMAFSFSFFLFSVDAVIFLIALVILRISVKEFKAKYLLGQKKKTSYFMADFCLGVFLVVFNSGDRTL